MSTNDALNTAIGDLDDKYLLCRDLGHRWSLRSRVSRLVETLAERHEPVVERVVRCTVCTCTRTEQVRRRDGELIRRIYKYPDGYRFPAGVAGKGGMAKAPFRQEWVRRSIAEVDDA